MEFTDFAAGHDDDERRLDRIARKFLAEDSISQVYKSIRSGLIKVNGRRQDPGFRVHDGDRISIADFLTSGADTSTGTAGQGEKSMSTDNESLKQITVLRTKDLLFIDKPYNICVQNASRKEESLDSIVKSAYSKQGQDKSLSFRPGPLHRLDRQTTGLVVFSQSIDGARWFSHALSEHRLVKKYIAVTEGAMEREETWEDSVSKENNSERMYKKADRYSFFHTVSASRMSGGKYAMTKALPLACGSYNGKPVTLVEYTLFTGRKHQIRASSARHGFPLLGDSAYGAEKINEPQHLYLHSFSICFPKNPLSLPEKVEIAPGENFKALLRKSLINWNCGL